MKNTKTDRAIIYGGLGALMGMGALYIHMGNKPLGIIFLLVSTIAMCYQELGPRDGWF